MRCWDAGWLDRSTFAFLWLRSSSTHVHITLAPHSQQAAGPENTVLYHSSIEEDSPPGAKGKNPIKWTTEGGMLGKLMWPSLVLH